MTSRKCGKCVLEMEIMLRLLNRERLSWDNWYNVSLTRVNVIFVGGFSVLKWTTDGIRGKGRGKRGEGEQSRK